MDSLSSMIGIQDLLELYEDKVTITPQGILGFLNKGIKGTKTIPFTSITAIQFKEAGALSGFLRFSILGGDENHRGTLDAPRDENCFMFPRGEGKNKLAGEIKTYIEERIQELKVSPQQNSASLADEILKLATLRDKGILSEEEFLAAKGKLLG